MPRDLGQEGLVAEVRVVTRALPMPLSSSVCSNSGTVEGALVWCHR